MFTAVQCTNDLLYTHNFSCVNSAPYIVCAYINSSDVNVMCTWVFSCDGTQWDFRKVDRKTYVLVGVTTRYVLFFQYRFASKWDWFLIFVGCIFTIVTAFTPSLINIIYSEATNLLIERTYAIGTSTPTWCLQWFGGGKIL